MLKNKARKTSIINMNTVNFSSFFCLSNEIIHPGPKCEATQNILQNVMLKHTSTCGRLT